VDPAFCQPASRPWGAVSHPEQAITFANAFLSAGAAQVVATQWRVLDDAAGIIACRLYDLAADDLSDVVESLRAAQHWFRDSPEEAVAAARSYGFSVAESSLAWWGPSDRVGSLPPPTLSGVRRWQRRSSRPPLPRLRWPQRPGL